VNKTIKKEELNPKWPFS